MASLVMVTEPDEHGVATLNLYCCRARPDFPWNDELARALGAIRVDVRVVTRGSTREAG